jgi:hypothetical protein
MTRFSIRVSGPEVFPLGFKPVIWSKVLLAVLLIVRVLGITVDALGIVLVILDTLAIALNVLAAPWRFPLALWPLPWTLWSSSWSSPLVALAVLVL